MSPRIVGCLLLSIVAGLAASAGALAAGWGLLLALVAYSAAGSLTLVAAAAALAALEGGRPERRRPARAGRRFDPATAHSG